MIALFVTSLLIVSASYGLLRLRDYLRGDSAPTKRRHEIHVVGRAGIVRARQVSTARTR